MLTHGREHMRPPARVVILGARGFISRHLQRRCLDEGVPFRAIGSGEINLTDSTSASDLAGLLREDDAIVMTSTLTPEHGRDYRVFMANVRMAETVCLALDRARCAHFVYLSSDAVYDAQKIPLDEDSTREPTDLYALAHVAREMILGSELERRGIPLCVLRLTNIYGTGDTHNAYGPNRFVRTALNEGRIEIFGGGEERRSHVSIADAVDLIGRCLRLRSAGTLNVAVRHAVSFKSVAEEVARLVGHPVQIKHVQRTVKPIHKPYKPTQVFRFIYNLGRPIGPIVHRTFLNAAVFKAFPEFAFTPLDTGLASFIAAERATRGAEHAGATTGTGGSSS